VGDPKVTVSGDAVYINRKTNTIMTNGSFTLSATE
jgi:hypothetical protein